MHGPARRVARWLYSLPADVVAAQLYILLLQGVARSGVYVFRREPADPRTATVLAAEGDGLGDLPSALATVLAEDRTGNGGAASVVDAALALLEGSCSSPPEPSAPALAPSTPRGAFGLPLVTLDERGAVTACVVSFPGGRG